MEAYKNKAEVLADVKLALIKKGEIAKLKAYNKARIKELEDELEPIEDRLKAFGPVWASPSEVDGSTTTFAVDEGTASITKKPIKELGKAFIKAHPVLVQKFADAEEDIVSISIMELRKYLKKEGLNPAEIEAKIDEYGPVVKITNALSLKPLKK